MSMNGIYKLGVHVEVLGVLCSFRFVLLILLTTSWDIKCLLAT